MPSTRLPLVLAVQCAALCVSGALAFVWKYVGMAEVPAFVRAGAASAALLLCVRQFVPEGYALLSVPISIFIMNTLTAFGGLLGIRWRAGRSRSAASAGAGRPGTAARGGRRCCSSAPGRPG